MSKSCAIWLVWGMGLATSLFWTTPAQAFYWYGWPGSGVPPDRVVVGPPGDGSGSGPRVPVGLPVVVTTPPPSGGETPEPATGLAAIVGLGIVAAARSIRRRKGSIIEEQTV